MGRDDNRNHTGRKEEFQSIFRRVPKWQDLWFYQKSEVLYQMTFVFCERFLPKFGDRTVDQMLQAARSGKQNIVEGSEDGKTSTEMELKLLNVARSSIGELRQDYEDFLKSRNLHIWNREDTRFQPMQEFTKAHNTLADYEPFFQKWSAEEMANVGLTLCYQVDTMMNKYMEGLERTFVTAPLSPREASRNACTKHAQATANNGTNASPSWKNSCHSYKNSLPRLKPPTRT